MLSNRILPNLMSFFIYSFHIFTYSHYSSMHIILSSHIYIRILYLSYILQYSSGLPKSQSQKVPIFSPKIWGLNHTAYYGPENSLCHYMTFIPSMLAPESHKASLNSYFPMEQGIVKLPGSFIFVGRLF